LIRAMRTFAAVVRCVPLLSLLSGCGDCWHTEVDTRCDVAGHLEVTSAGGPTYDNQGLSASCPTLSFGGRSYSGGSLPDSPPQDLNMGLMFTARETTGSATVSSTVAYTLKMVVRDVPPGPSEIDLDDARATLSGWSDLHGHVSISELSRDCSHGQDLCLLTLHATFAVSASSPDGTLSLSGVTLDAQDEYVHVQTMCAVIGE